MDIEAAGVANFSQLHDAQLVGIDAANASEHVVLSFVSDDGRSRYLVSLHGCSIFRICDYSLQNVASRVIVFSGTGSKLEGVEEILVWATSLSDAGTYLSSLRLEQIMNDIESGSASLLMVEPSCGAEVAALCDKVELKREIID